MRNFFVSMAIIAICTFILTGQATRAVAAQKSGDITKIVIETPIEAPVDTIFDESYPKGKFSFKLTPMGPYKLFDDFYYIGTNSVGSFVIDTSAGLILIDAGWGATDCGSMMSDLQKLGFNPKDIEMILLSHEHIDHYGCVKEWKNTACPSAKVALTQLGWNYLRTWPAEAAFGGSRPESIDMYLTDGQRIQLGNTTVEVVFTPGHSPGCVSFIFPVRDRGEKHVVGLMGGSSVPGTWNEALVYHTSVEYFKQKSIEAKCDVGLAVHAKQYKDDFEKIPTLQPGVPHPLVLGTERYVTEYIESYYENARRQFDRLKPQHFQMRGGRGSGPPQPLKQ